MLPEHAKVWRISPWPPAGFAASIGLPAFQAHLLFNRGVRQRSQVEPFLAADARLSNDPLLLPDMDKAVARLQRACLSGETVGIFGDFDTDGVTGTAVLAMGLSELGAKVVPYLPHRVREGHGLNLGAVKHFRRAGASLLVTVDCGVSSAREVESARRWGMDTVITDHHALPASLPQAHAIVHAAMPGSRFPPEEGLTGVGLAYKLVEALWAERSRGRPEHLLDLVALGTVADVATLKGENRFLVRRGLEVLNATTHPGLRALMERAGLRPGRIDTQSLAFGLIPRLNAAGRIGHSATSLQLLTAANDAEAQRAADELERRNNQRRILADRAIEEARLQVEAGADGVGPLIMVGHRGWRPGIVGLTASSLAEQYHRPAIAVSIGEDVSRASARSIPEFDMIAALRTCENRFIRYGGHPQAAGFTLSTGDLPALREELVALAERALAGKDLRPRLDVDFELSPAVLTGPNLDFLQALSPFGEGNPEPTFMVRNAGVVEPRKVGADGRHLKLRVAVDGGSWDAIAFRQGARIDAAMGRVDVVYAAGTDDWGGRPRLQLNVLDFRPAR